MAIVDELPLTGDRGRSLVGLRAGDTDTEAVVREAGPAYFDVMRIPHRRRPIVWSPRRFFGTGARGGQRVAGHEAVRMVGSAVRSDGAAAAALPAAIGA